MESEPNQYRLLNETLETWWRHACGDPLTEDYDPDIAVPCSRYGRTAGEVAWYTLGGLIAFEAAAGIENQVEAIMLLDELMGLAVNDSPDIAMLIVDSWDYMPAELREHFGEYADVRELMG